MLIIFLWERRRVAICFTIDFNFTARHRSCKIENAELN